MFFELNAFQAGWGFLRSPLQTANIKAVTSRSPWTGSVRPWFHRTTRTFTSMRSALQFSTDPRGRFAEEQLHRSHYSGGVFASNPTSGLVCLQERTHEPIDASCWTGSANSSPCRKRLMCGRLWNSEHSTVSTLMTV
jgi:hypothetical protein